MYSSEDLERFYFQYQTEGLPHGESMQSFCVKNKEPYNIFLKWYKDTRKRIVEVKVDGKHLFFLSFFEDFGIPPLEALSVGAKIIVSNTSCLPEIFGDSAYYIDPHNYNINLDSLLSTSVKDRQLVLNRFNFRIFAKRIHNHVLKLNT